MKEFFLAAFSFGQELNIINDQDIDMAVSVAKLMERTAFDRADEVIDEGFTGEVAVFETGLTLLDSMADTLEQMGFTEPGRPICEERVIRPSGVFGDSDRRGVGQSVTWPGNKIVEGIARIQAKCPVACAKREVRDGLVVVLIAIRIELDCNESPGSCLGCLDEGWSAVLLEVARLGAVARSDREYSSVEPTEFEVGERGHHLFRGLRNLHPI